MNDKEARGPVEMRNLVGELRLAGSRLCHRAADALEGLLGEREPCATVSEDNLTRVKKIILESLVFTNENSDPWAQLLAENIVDAIIGQAAVPDAATEQVTENSVRHVKRLTTELRNKRESLNDQRREFRKLLTDARAERDAALEAIERVRQAVAGHPECDRYEEGDVISCGWKSAYASVIAALDGAPEPEEKP